MRRPEQVQQCARAPGAARTDGQSGAVGCRLAPSLTARLTSITCVSWGASMLPEGAAKRERRAKGREDQGPWTPGDLRCDC